MQQQLDMQDSSGQMGLGSALVQLGLEIASAFVGRAMQSPTHRLTILAMLEGELRRQRRLPPGGFRGLLGCARRTYLYDGPLSFFRGLGTEFVLTLPATIANYAASQIVSLIAQNTINFAAMSEGQQLVASIAFSTLLEQLTAVVQDPISTVTTTYIADIVPETEGGTFAFSGPIAAVKAIYKAKGIAGFYQGISTAALLSISYRWSYYALLHAAFSFLSQEQQDSVGMTVARLISLVSGAFCQPVEVVRRRLQYAAHTDQPYQSTLDCVKTIVREEGVTALWAGYKMRVLVTLAGFAIVDGLTFLQTQL